ncbi:HlyD family efflux transporter periplasmic adaptor subunit [bacterium]|nr:HlyD family efflux transporter periplasmic adaptor subunit [bacterium]
MTKPVSKGKIPIPVSRRLRILQTTLLPFAIWVVAAGICVILYNRQSGSVTVSGLVEGRQSNLAPLVDARLVTLPVGILDDVQSGDVLATFDDSEVRAELSVLEAQAQTLQAQVTAEQARLAKEAKLADESRQLDLRRLQVDVENARLEIVNRRIQIETSRVDLNRLHVERQYSERLIDAGVSEQMDYDIASVQAEALEQAIAEGQKALEEAEGQLKESKDRLQKFEEVTGLESEVDVAVAPLRQQLDVLAAEVDLARTHLPSLVLRSPIDGVITQVAATPGENIVAGTPILTVTERRAETIVAYLPENARMEPNPGDIAEVRSAQPGGGVLAEAKVVSVSPAVQVVPARLFRDPNRPEFGRAILLTLGSASNLLPGERATITFHQ